MDENEIYMETVGATASMFTHVNNLEAAEVHVCQHRPDSSYI